MLKTVHRNLPGKSRIPQPAPTNGRQKACPFLVGSNRLSRGRRRHQGEPLLEFLWPKISAQDPGSYQS